MKPPATTPPSPGWNNEWILSVGKRRRWSWGGLAVSSTRFGDGFRQRTGPGGFPEDETTLELTYRAQVTRWLALQADAQLLFNPATNPDSGSRETAVVLGLRAQVSF